MLAEKLIGKNFKKEREDRRRKKGQIIYAYKKRMVFPLTSLLM